MPLEREKLAQVIQTEINKKGHEIQSHGFSHRPVNQMSPKKFQSELRETNKRLEDITGEPVVGFRAPDFSIDKNTFWAFEVMIEEGLTYDSSIFPMKTRRYGIKGFQGGYSIVHTASGTIEELTVSVYESPIGIRLPVGGGGYIRLWPSWWLRFCLNKSDNQAIPFIVYCHPYEFNPKEWDQILKYIPKFRRIQQGVGRNKFPDKLLSLLKSKPFGPIYRVLGNCRDRYTKSKL